MAWQNLPPWIHDSWTTSGLISPHLMNGWLVGCLWRNGSGFYIAILVKIWRSFIISHIMVISFSKLGYPKPLVSLNVSLLSLLKKMTVFGWFRGPHFWRNTQLLTSCSCLALCEDFLSTLLPGHFEVPPAVAATLLQQSQGGNVRKPNL